MPRASRSSVPITSETLSGFCCKWVSSSPTGHKYLSLRFGLVLSLSVFRLFFGFFSLDDLGGSFVVTCML